MTYCIQQVKRFAIKQNGQEITLRMGIMDIK